MNNIKNSVIQCDLFSPKILNLPICLPMSDTYFGLVTSIFAIGGLVGAFFGGYCSEKYGRKKYLVFNALFFFVGSLVEMFSTTPGMLVAGRFISGLGSGGGVVTAPMYLTEIAPIKYRGFLNTFNQMLIVVGIFIAQLMGYFFNTGNRWRYVIVLSVISSVANMLTMLLVVESPKYLISKGKVPEARIALIRLRGISFVDDEISFWENSESEFSNSLQSNPNDNRTNIGLIKIMTMKKYRLALILAFCLQTAQQLSGINTIFFYSNEIFSKMFSSSKSAVLTLIVGSVNVIFTLLVEFIIDRLGRKVLLLASMGSMVICLSVLTISLVHRINILSIILIYLTTISFISGLGALPYLIATELFDQRAMSAGNTVSISANWIWTFVIGMAFLSLQEKLGDYVNILFIGFLIIFGAFFYLYLPETKDKTYNAVSKELLNKHL
ncbi:Solute carrier family 2, facilitated glucose transporter member 2 [Smittium mucronatum]|uniref:Solute carrier family 2, facilitated glucose transporter member 2 n=1 Tax=Smittium mucronatum TaxID=133383 RepID=A0A1R0GZ93_9FUNG|nr:Solute carrier family 2, facilitated glucose transporter member 2 [Smittium mucronatum]